VAVLPVAAMSLVNFEYDAVMTNKNKGKTAGEQKKKVIVIFQWLGEH